MSPRHRFPFLFFVIFLAATGFGAAKPLQHDGVVYTLPENWTVDQTDPTVLTARSAGGEATFTIVSMPGEVKAEDMDQTLHDTVVAAIKAMQQQGCTVANPKLYSRDDLQLVEIVGKIADDKGKGIIIKRYVSVQPDCVYLISFQYNVPDVNAFDDPTTLKVLQSLQIGPIPVAVLKKPHPHTQ